MFDKQSIDIPCANCGRKTSKTIGWLKTNRQMTCRCGTVLNLDTSDLRAKIKQLERQLGKLLK